MRDFRKLKVWAKAHALTLEIYRVTDAFPSDEQNGLTADLKRAAISIPGKIARGCGVGSKRGLSHCLAVSIGAASETQYHLLLARDLGYVSNDDYPYLDSQLEEIKRRLSFLIIKIRGDLND